MNNRNREKGQFLPFFFIALIVVMVVLALLSLIAQDNPNSLLASIFL